MQKRLVEARARIASIPEPQPRRADRPERLRFDRPANDNSPPLFQRVGLSLALVAVLFLGAVALWYALGLSG